jgi:hypothetical protein
MVNNKGENKMESNFIVKVYNPVTGLLGQEKLFNNLVDAIEFKNKEEEWGYPTKCFRFVEFNEVPGGVS